MLSFTSNLSSDSGAFAIFVSEKYDYNDKSNILSKKSVEKINSFLRDLKVEKKEEHIHSLDISNKQRCLIIKVKSKYESFYPEETGGAFFSYLKNLIFLKEPPFSDLLVTFLPKLLVHEG